LETNNIESNSSKKGTEARKIALQSDQDPKTSTNNAKEGKPRSKTQNQDAAVNAKTTNSSP
jgi:hypothetical protein